MGLLDEAIREHLELKRRSGGDPSEIAREEHEALAPVFGEADGAAEAPPAQAEEAHPGAGEHPRDQPVAEPAPADEFSSVGQETAELDMESVLGSEEMLTKEHAAPPPPPPPPEPGPDQERLSFE